MQIWDTAGQESYRSLNRIYFRNTSACILVVDITSDKIESCLDLWMKEFMTMGSQTGSQSVNVDNNRSAHTSSIGSTDFHVE